MSTFLDGRVTLHAGDCIEVMRSLPDASVDAIVCDPPYGLSFMGKGWDHGVPGVEYWIEALRVLKPGGYLVAFSGTRTYHRMACAIEDAGFEIMDQIGWAYGCLDEATLAVTPRGNLPHSLLKSGDLVLTYDVGTQSYQWGEIEHVHRYDVSDTVYRISTDHGEQVVSRNHRCIVERDGAETFALAEDAARQREARVPILENLQGLLAAVSDAHEGAGDAQRHVLASVQGCRDWGKGAGTPFAAQQARDGGLRGLRQGEDDTAITATQGRSPDLLTRMQRRSSGCGVEGSRAQGTSGMVGGVGSCAGGALHGAVQSIVEGWRHLSTAAWQLCERALCPVPAGVLGYGADGRLSDGTTACGGSHSRAMPDARGVGAPYRPQAAQQLPGEPHAVRDEQGSQAVRAWPGHKTVVGRVTPEHYDGVIWCVTVRTGAFVAVRKGMAFQTGNSGFPKSLDVSKAIDKAAGVEREKIAVGAPVKRMIPGADQNGTGSWVKDNGREYQPGIEVPATAAAKEWSGWGTALKPAWEPICLARKPLIGTVAQNVLTHGTGALNIDGCRVEASGRPLRELDAKATSSNVYAGRTGDGGLGKGLDGGSKAVGTTDVGRFPANLIHDGSEEVLAGFPETTSGGGPAAGTDRTQQNTYGKPTVSLSEPYGSNTGSAARFFYTAKADADDRIGSKHPTVKPVDLMQWLCRLVCRKGGTVLDPFAGTGTTGEAAWREGMNAILIEREPEYQEDIARRMDLIGKPSKRKAVAKTKGKITADAGPLFGGGS